MDFNDEVFFPIGSRDGNVTCFTILLNDDIIFENDEEFQVTMSSFLEPNVLIEDRTIIITILSDESKL